MAKKQLEKKEKAEVVVDEKAKTVELSEGTVNLKERVECTATKTHPYEKEGATISCSPVVKAKAIMMGWAK